MSTLLQAAIETLKRGDRAAGRRMLLQVIEQNPDSEVAWMWMAFAVGKAEQRKRALERVLEINPDNARAAEELEKLEPAKEQVAPEEVELPAPESQAVVSEEPKETGRRGCAPTVVLLFVVFMGVWFLVRPGVFTVQPIGALPEGVTLVYHSRVPEIPFFSSPDGLCLEIQGSVSLLCRGVALSSSETLIDRVLFRLPYNHWAYLRSTGGREFDR